MYILKIKKGKKEQFVEIQTTSERPNKEIIAVTQAYKKIGWEVLGVYKLNNPLTGSNK